MSLRCLYGRKIILPKPVAWFPRLKIEWSSDQGEFLLKDWSSTWGKQQIIPQIYTVSLTDCKTKKESLLMLSFCLNINFINILKSLKSLKMQFCGDDSILDPLSIHPFEIYSFLKFI